MFNLKATAISETFLTQKNDINSFFSFFLFFFFFFEQATFSPDGRCIACGSADGNILIWDILSSKLIQKLVPNSTASQPLSPVSSVSWSMKGVLVSVDKNGKCVLWK